MNELKKIEERVLEEIKSSGKLQWADDQDVVEAVRFLFYLNRKIYFLETNKRYLTQGIYGDVCYIANVMSDFTEMNNEILANYREFFNKCRKEGFKDIIGSIEENLPIPTKHGFRSKPIPKKKKRKIGFELPFSNE